MSALRLNDPRARSDAYMAGYVRPTTRRRASGTINSGVSIRRPRSETVWRVGVKELCAPHVQVVRPRQRRPDQQIR